MPRVLIVDDEAGIRFALRRWFERQHWVVDEAQDGRQALEVIESETPETALDLIVTDLHLPGIAGDELLRTLLATRPTLATRVILTTGDDVQDAAHGSVLATHPYVLQKPFDLATLRATVDRVLG